MVGSDYSPTIGHPPADICFCKTRGLSELENAMLWRSPFRILMLDSWANGAHRQRILEEFSALESLPTAADSTPPRLVVAHFLSPHPPFVFEEPVVPRPSALCAGDARCE